MVVEVLDIHDLMEKYFADGFTMEGLSKSVEFDNQNKVCRVSKVDPVSINHERSLTIEDCLYEYSTYEGYLSGLKECEKMWKSVGINDYVVIGFNSEKVKKELKNKIVFPYSIFNLVALHDKKIFGYN